MMIHVRRLFSPTWALLLSLSLCAALAAIVAAWSVPAANADVYYGPALLRDLWADGLKLAWSTPSSCYFFPDLALMVLPFAVTHDAATALLWAWFGNVALLVAGVAYLLAVQSDLFCYSLGRGSWFFWSGCLKEASWMVSGYLALLLLDVRHIAFLNATWTTYHQGALLLTVWIVALSWSARTTPVGARPLPRDQDRILSVVAVLVALGAASDQILLVWCVLPLSLVLLFDLKSSWRTLLALGLGVALAQVLIALLHFGQVVVPGNLSAAALRLTPAAAWAALCRTPWPLPLVFLPLFVFVPVAWFKWRRVSFDHFLLTFVALSLVLCVTVPVLTGLWIDEWCVRYLLPALFFPALLSAWAVLHFRRGEVLLLAFCCAVLLYHAPRLREVPSITALPRAVLVMQEAPSRNVIADYWIAKYLTERTAGVMQVNAFTPDLRPLPRIANVADYIDGGEAAKYNAVIVDRLDREALLRELGQPTDTMLVPHQGGGEGPPSEVWLYYPAVEVPGCLRNLRRWCAIQRVAEPWYERPGIVGNPLKWYGPALHRDLSR